MSNIYIYLSTYGKKIKKNWYGEPIEVGAIGRENFVYSLKDFEGDNISIDNPIMAELTGMYYVWKNIKMKEEDIIGFAHYNKVLRVNKRRINRLFSNAGENNLWIVRKPVVAHVHDYPNDIKELEDILLKGNVKYYRAWSQLYNNDGSSKKKNCNAANMFITTRKQFDEYCEWLFPIMYELKRRIGETDRVPYHKRYCAFIAERLLSVYIKANKCEVKEVEMDYGESLIRYWGRVILSPLPESIIKKIPFVKKGESSYL